MAKDELIDETTKKLNLILASMQKQFGKEAIMLPSLGSGSNISWVATASPNINNLMGYGIPMGRMIEIYGQEASGKTSLACFIGGAYQAASKVVAYIDLEHALDHQYATTLGLDINKTLLSQPDSAEEAMNILKALIIAGTDLVVIDSTDALVPQAEQEADFEDQQMALKARLLSKVCRNITPLMKNHGTTVIFISQTRAVIGSMSNDKDQSSSPRSIRFYSSIRIKCTFSDWVKGRSGDEGELIGMLSRLKTVKNKLVAPGRIRVVKILFGKGYQTEEEWIEYATLHDVIKKTSPGWYVIPSGEKVQGLAKLISIVQQDPELKKYVISETQKRMAVTVESPNLLDLEQEEKTSSVEIEETLSDVAPVGGTQEVSNVINSALDANVIERKPAGWFVLPNGRKIQGLDKLLDLVLKDRTLYELILEELKQPQELIEDDLEGLEDIAPIDEAVAVVE